VGQYLDRECGIAEFTVFLSLIKYVGEHENMVFFPDKIGDWLYDEGSSIYINSIGIHEFI